MKLRSRLLFGYWYLVGLLVVAATTATFGFLHLSAGIDVVLEENFKSIRAGMRMVEALERLDSATLAALAGEEPSAGQVRELDNELLGALEVARGNVTEEEEVPILEVIAEGFEAYRSARDALLAGAVGIASEAPIRYRESVFPRFISLKRSMLDLVEINQRAMIEADREAREAALRNAVWLGVLVGVALLSLIGLSRALQRHFLSRLVRLERAMAAIAEGEESRRLRQEGDDELSLIARQFNRLLDRRQEQAASAEGRVARERRLALTLLSQVGDDAALYGLSGALMASAAQPSRFESEVADWISGRGRELLERWLEQPGDDPPPSAEVELEDGTRVRVRLLALGRAGVGWLVARS